MKGEEEYRVLNNNLFDSILWFMQYKYYISFEDIKVVKNDDTKLYSQQ